MGLFNTILVPTDFSAAADAAISYASALARKFNSSIVLYHAFIPFDSGFYPFAQSQLENQRTEEDLTSRLSAIRDTLLEKDGHRSVSVHVDRGPEAIRLLEYSQKNKTELIVMGTRGATGLKEIIMGSFTSEIMMKAGCPVLAIPQHYQFTLPRMITFATSCRSGDISALEFLLQWNEGFRAEITVLHVSCDDEKEKNSFPHFKTIIQKKFPGQVFHFEHTKGKNIAVELLRRGDRDQAGILVLSQIEREGIWSRLFHRSVTKATACHIQTPLLTLPVR